MIHSNNDGTTSLTNIYFEEILPDDISDADDHKQGNIKTMSKPIQTKSEPNISNHSISNKIKNENEWKINHLSKCTQTTIGGGTSLTLIHSNDSKLANIYISFGGCDRNGNISNSVNMYNPSSNTWIENVPCTGMPPSPRYGHSAVSIQNHLYIFGGQGLWNKHDDICSSKDLLKHKSFNDVHCLDTTSMHWKPIPIQKKDDPIPTQRNSHTAVILHGTMIVYGGANSNAGPLNDIWEYNFTNHKWNPIQVHGECIPEPREMHSACVINHMIPNTSPSCMIIVGGRNHTGKVCSDVWMLHSDGWIWTKLKDLPHPRCAHTVRIDTSTDLMHVFGGWDGKQLIYSDLLEYNLTTHQWTDHIVLNPKPTKRFGHACANAIEEGFLIFGGVNCNNDFKDLCLIFPKE